MSDHEDRDSLLVAYVDGELDAGAALTVEHMLAAHPALRSDVEMFRNTAMLLRAACGEQHYATRQQGAKLPTPSPLARRRRTMGLLAASAALVVAGAGGGMLWRASDEDDLLGEIARYHATLALETDHLAEVGSDRKAEFSTWMGDRLGRRLSVPDLRSVGLHYAGGRMLVVDDGPVADFLFTRTYGGPVGLCVVRATDRTGGLRIATRHGMRLASWTVDRLTFIVVGDLAAEMARRVADTVRDQLGA